MKILTLILNLIVLTACNGTKKVEPDATSGNINVSAPYMWSSTAFPRNLKISDSFATAEFLNIQDMSTAWETSVENKMNFFNSGERTTEVSDPNLDLDTLGDDAVNGVYKITSWPLSLNSGALAVTQIFGRRFNIGASNEYVRIEHADILVNYNLYDFRTDDTLNGSYDLRTVVLHEMGHFLGLNHKYGTTVMIPSIGTSTVNRAPQSVDIVDLGTKYSIPISTSASSAIIATNNVSYSAKPGDKGQQVKIMIELRADGECVHKENGAVIQRHFLHK